MVPVTYPGRESRYGEPLLRSVRELANFVVGTMPTPTCRAVLYGHSLGALVAFETAVLLEHAGAGPLAIIVAAHGAPSMPQAGRGLHRLPDAALVDGLRTLGGIEAELLAEPELLELVIPRIRADLEAAETYSPVRQGVALSCPVLVLGGSNDDHVTRASLEAWSTSTRASCHVEIVDGDHFFHRTHPTRVQGIIAEFLGKLGA